MGLCGRKLSLRPSHALSSPLLFSLPHFSIMETILFSSKPAPSQILTINHHINPFFAPRKSVTIKTFKSTPYPTIRSAISRNKKESTVETVKDHLQNCYLLAGIKYKGLTVKQLQDFRKTLPDTAKLLVAKNTLVGKAIEGTKWEALKPCMKGMNAWLFVHSEEIPAAIKPYRTFQREKKLEDNDFTGAVFEGKFYGPADFKTLESMPTRAEIYATLLGSLNSPATSLVGTIQAPAREVVMILKAYVKKLEEEGGEQ